MSDDDRVDAEIRRADPLRSGGTPLDPALIERIVVTGPAAPAAGQRRVVLAVAAATVAVMVGAFATVRAVGPEEARPVAAPATTPAARPAPTTSPSPARACRTSGWHAGSLPAGYQPADPASVRDDGWDGKWESPDGTVQVVLNATCEAFGVGRFRKVRPDRRVGGHPARVTVTDGALWLYVQRGGVMLELSTYESGAAPEAVVVAIGAALTDDPAVPGPAVPADTCSTVLPAWRFETPAGFRLVGTAQEGRQTRLFRYRRDATVVSISVSCPGTVDFSEGWEPLPVPFGRAAYAPVPTELSVAWQAGRRLAVLIETAPATGTKADLLAFVAAARAT